ncbi:hypothetical protein BO71DRAFT_407354 [Aspergillus ellipticus CBS 707.79]|uniref:Uncharacterized protein n=1 Tax=Aspergillus ellipticus CBS 707.79 TaxID=1448320 RepID=A0A319E8E6_9EURO|nr:hypothetical protein BO71DRAFT_407354 [Aspergillus ellipticus CBS 707.79]
MLYRGHLAIRITEHHIVALYLSESLVTVFCARQVTESIHPLQANLPIKPISPKLTNQLAWLKPVQRTRQDAMPHIEYNEVALRGLQLIGQQTSRPGLGASFANHSSLAESMSLLITHSVAASANPPFYVTRSGAMIAFWSIQSASRRAINTECRSLDQSGRRVWDAPTGAGSIDGFAYAGCWMVGGTDVLCVWHIHSIYSIRYSHIIILTTTPIDNAQTNTVHSTCASQALMNPNPQNHPHKQ